MGFFMSLFNRKWDAVNGSRNIAESHKKLVKINIIL